MNLLFRAFIFLLAFSFTSACGIKRQSPVNVGSESSFFTISEFIPAAGASTWNQLHVAMQRIDGDKAAVNQDFPLASFQSSQVQNVRLKVAQGTYTIYLTYTDVSGATVYTECASVHTKSYLINVAQFETQIPICAVGSTTPKGNIDVAPTSDVTITPQLGGNSAASGQQSGSGQSAGGQPSGGQSSQTAVCSTGLSQGAAPDSKTSQYPISGSLSQLPHLTVSASATDIKKFVTTVYESFAIFPTIYETQLGLSKQQALAYMFADMSRESGGNLASGIVSWRIDWETGQGGPGDAWGPFQAAVTNFQGGGYDASIEDYSGLPIPAMAQFKDPATSTYAGMKRLADGILNAIKILGDGQPAQLYLLGSLADHNTGYPNAAKDQSWLSSYGNEVLRIMAGYQQNDNLTNNTVFWTGEPASDWGCH